MPHSPTATLFYNANVATMLGGDAGLIDNGAVVVHDGLIDWVGPTNESEDALIALRDRLPDEVEVEAFDCDGRLLTPGLIDCHTHLVYGGDRSAEFEQRLEGVSYEEIARAGGGIVSTVAATRAASKEELLIAALDRLDALMASGVTTVEVKSGYGLDLETEVRCLETARDLPQHRSIDVMTTYLGAHTVPPEYADDRSGYLDLVTNEVLPRVVERGLADAVDGFCEGIAFSVAEMETVFDAAQELKLRIKLHAEQLSNLGGAAMAASRTALSADHLEYLDLEGVLAMAEAGTVAVLLPGAFYYLRETQKPPVALLREHSVPIAIATDLNPGSSPVHSLVDTMNQACVLFELTPTEALRGVTVNAARALGLKDRGVLAADMRADLCLWNVDQPVGLCYPLGHSPLLTAVKDGIVQTRSTELASLGDPLSDTASREHD